MRRNARSGRRGRAALLPALFLLAAAGAHAAAPEPQCGTILGDAAASIEACTRTIDSGRVVGAELAKAYYSRGTEYGNIGDHERAVNDLNVSIQLDPTFAAAYYNRGLSWSARGDSDHAIADYDAALKLTPRDSTIVLARAAEWIAKRDYKRAIADFDEATRLGQPGAGYFGRARAKFYAGDFMGAASDFYRVHQFDASIYSALWLYLARKRADIPGEKTLAQEAGTSGSGEWPAPIVGLYLGRSTPEAVHAAASHQNASRQRAQRCEANFYIAEWHLARGAREAALPLLRDAASACPQGFIEHEGAVAELARIERSR